MMSFVDPVNRRSFLFSATAATTVAAGATLKPLRALAAQYRHVPIQMIVYDDVHPSAAAFGRSAQAAGFAAHAVGKNVVPLWYDGLLPQLRQKPGLVIGLTNQVTAFCLEGLAASHWMRSVLFIDHRPSAGEHPRHLAQRSREERAAFLLQGNWGLEGRQLLGEDPVGVGAHGDGTPKRFEAEMAETERGHLVSWVLAPREFWSRAR